MTGLRCCFLLIWVLAMPECRTLWAASAGSPPSSAPEAGEPGEEDVLTRARSLATNGRQAEALELLNQHLADNPRDGDARLIYGLVLSWDGRYSDAREHLEKVLADYPDYLDAALALANVELWSDHPERAEEVTREGLRRWPDDTTLLLYRARVLKALNRDTEALQATERLLSVDPENHQARRMHQILEGGSLRWQLRVNHDTEWFSDGRDPWQESRLELERHTSLGPIFARLSRADRFSLRSNQMEIDFFPQIRGGTYLYLNFGYSPDRTLYPTYRAGAEIHQSLGKGFEGSAGFRRASFAANINTYTASLSKYHGQWLFSGRMYLTPALSGTTRSFLVSTRRYLGYGAHFVEVRYGKGASIDEIRSINDILILDAERVSGELHLRLARRFRLRLRTGYSLEDRINRKGLRRYLAGGSLFFLF